TQHGIWLIVWIKTTRASQWDWCVLYQRCNQYHWKALGFNGQGSLLSSFFLQANNLVFHSALEAYRESCRTAEQRGERHQHENSSTSAWPLPHILVSNVEHDSVRLTAEHLLKDATAVLRRDVSGGFQGDGEGGGRGCVGGSPLLHLSRLYHDGQQRDRSPDGEGHTHTPVSSLS
uniref:Uncharacterized protein n=1 Tax=Hucho hucho TaxID=62062 RepID=A0A4W5KRZ1_9TELE